MHILLDVFERYRYILLRPGDACTGTLTVLIMASTVGSRNSKVLNSKKLSLVNEKQLQLKVVNLSKPA